MHGASSLQNVMILQDPIVQENLNNISIAFMQNTRLRSMLIWYGMLVR